MYFCFMIQHWVRDIVVPCMTPKWWHCDVMKVSLFMPYPSRQYVDHTIVVFIIGWVIPEKLAWYPFNNIAFGLPWWRRVVSDDGMTAYSSCPLLRRHCTTAASNVKMMTQTQIETVAFNQISNAKAVFILAPGEKSLELPINYPSIRKLCRLL